MLYQIALKLHKVFNEPDPVIRTETVRVFEQSVCSRRQLEHHSKQTLPRKQAD